MIPKYQRVLFFTLTGAILLMALVLLRGCEQAREKLTRHRDSTPLAAPVATPSEKVTLLLANDMDGSIAAVEREVALPAEPTVRARALLARLIADYTFKGSMHPLESGPAIDDVFFVPLPVRAPVNLNAPVSTVPDLAANAAPVTFAKYYRPGAMLAVVDLHGSFAGDHPSGVEAETLTVQSIIGTLHAAFPQIEEVRFLVDGQARETLNGHADLLRTYLCVDTATPSGGR